MKITNIKEYNTELKKVLMTKDYKELQKFVQEQQGLKMRDNVAEITLHKMICNKTDLPKKMQKESKKWLNNRGYSEHIW